MRTFLQKHSYLAGILVLISLAIPFVKLQNVSSYAAIGAEDGQIISYAYYSFYEILVNATSGLFKSNLSLPEVIMVLLCYVFIVIVLFQFVASIRKRYKATLNTAIVLIALAVLLLLYIILYSNTVIYIGYYLFLILQILLIVFSYKTLTHATNTTR